MNQKICHQKLCSLFSTIPLSPQLLPNLSNQMDLKFYHTSHEPYAVSYLCLCICFKSKMTIKLLHSYTLVDISYGLCSTLFIYVYQIVLAFLLHKLCSMLIVSPAQFLVLVFMHVCVGTYVLLPLFDQHHRHLGFLFLSLVGIFITSHHFFARPLCLLWGAVFRSVWYFILLTSSWSSVK